MATADAAAATAETIEEGRGRYRALTRRKLIILAVMTAALCLSFATDLAWGPARYGLDQVVAALFDPASVSDQVRTVVWDIRMPVAVMAIVVGAAVERANGVVDVAMLDAMKLEVVLGDRQAQALGRVGDAGNLCNHVGGALALPQLEHGVQQRCAVGEMPVEGALRRGELFCQALDPHRLDAAFGQGCYAGKGPVERGEAGSVSHKAIPGSGKRTHPYAAVWTRRKSCATYATVW